jgi:hypothetical protein
MNAAHAEALAPSSPASRCASGRVKHELLIHRHPSLDLVYRHAADAEIRLRLRREKVVDRQRLSGDID